MVHAWEFGIGCDPERILAVAKRYSGTGAVYSLAGTLMRPPVRHPSDTVFALLFGLRVGNPYFARKCAYSSESKRFSISLLMVRSQCRQLASGRTNPPFRASGTMCSSPNRLTPGGR